MAHVTATVFTSSQQPYPSMSFSTNASKTKAQTAVNRLFAAILPGLAEAPTPGALLATEQLSKQLSTKNKLLSEEIKKLNKSRKLKQSRHIAKKLEQNRKFAKLVKYNIIKNHKLAAAAGAGVLSEEEEKYLNKLVKKNTNMLNRLSEVDDLLVRDELDDIKRDILQLTAQKTRENKTVSKNLRDFNEKINSGVVAYPGLTPGLAPVGMDDESDDE